ncbi:DUF924 family protein [Rhodanobacter geophilus]|uniref:DUF924 family protein n=1 Tax=Rhodanobacter geophilus TaxID=3162488 RepID=A0ABV3QMQ1_9GAMM
MTEIVQPREVVRFWREAGPDKWFGRDEAFDREFSTRFHDVHMVAARRRLDPWLDDAEGALALLILLDQFPRNAFRGTAHMFATDPLALSFAREAIARGHDRAVEPALRVFFYLPFEHSEAPADQDRAVVLCEGLDNYARYARVHREVIARFGRFPHRNAVLGRETMAGEQAFLDEGGFAG